MEVGLPTWSLCTGVRRRWLVAFAGWRGRRLSASKVQRWLLGLWKTSGWFGLEVPAAVVVDSELCSKIQGARGVAPADGRLGDGLISFFGTSVHCGFFKAFVRWSTLRSSVVRRPEPGNPPRRGSPASSACKGVRGPRCNFFFLMDLCAIWDDQLYSVSLYGLPVSVRFP